MKKTLALLIAMFCTAVSAEVDSHSLIFNVDVNRPNLTIIPKVNFSYPKVGIKITSPGFELDNQGHDCAPASNGFCIFSTSPQNPKKLSVSGQGTVSFQLCANGLAPLNCQNYSADFPAKAYISNTRGGTAGGSGFISICNLDIKGNFTQADCTNVDKPEWVDPFGVDVTNNNLYVASGLGGTTGSQGFISVCALDSSGFFSPNSCVDVDKPEWNTPTGVTIDNNILYVVNDSGGSQGNGFVSVCKLDATGNFTPQNCTDISKINWVGPIGAHVANNKLYVTSSNGGTSGQPGFISICNLDKNGIFTPEDCIDVDKPEWSNPVGVAIKNNKLYLANQFGGTSGNIGFISVCILDSNGLFTPTNCTDIDKPEWNTPSGVTVNGRKLYIANQLGGTVGNQGFVSVCTLNEEGFFASSDCTDFDKAEWSETDDIAVR